jgi:katanin p60 ATPase-containing subunit A1
MVTKLDNKNDEKFSAQNGNGNNNQGNKNQTTSITKRKTGQIIDFRSMINEATKINFEEGNNENSVGFGLLIVFFKLYLLNFKKDRLMKPLAGYIGYNSEWRELAQVISRVKINQTVYFKLNLF